MTPRYNYDGVIDLFDPPPLTPDEVNGILGLSTDEIIIDCFAGGGGASEGIEWATGRSPDEAINHSAPALAIHELNHPKTRHHHSDIWEVDPIIVAAGRRVGLLWLSPDCTHFSRAKGGKPVSKKIRVLAHVAVRYAKAVRPRVIILENVPEFLTWGPVSRETGKPDPRRKGQSFKTFVRQLRREGYTVEWRLLRGCDYGAPTSRQRLFLVARCDGAAIRWPQPTHGPGRLEPWHTAAECIDFTIPCPSIFLTAAEAKALGLKVKRPLVPNTLRRIARGVYRFVISAAEPFIVPMQRENRPTSVYEPLQTVTTQGNKFNLVAPYLVPRYGEDPNRNGGEGQEPRSLGVDRPFPTIVPSGNGAQLVAAFLAKHFGGNETPGSALSQPIGTVTETDHHALVASSLVQFNRNCDGRSLNAPLPTIVSQGEKFAEVRAFLTTYYGTATGAGGSLREPMRTVTPHDRLALVMVQGVPYAIADIGMRMLTARELANGQGFRPDYVLDGSYLTLTSNGRTVRRRITETQQKAMVGNSVNPQLARAIVVANFGAPVAQERAA